MRLLICAGGTGGGVYPALAVLQALQNDESHPQPDILWVGGQGGMEADLVRNAYLNDARHIASIPFTTIPAAGLHGVGLRTLPANSAKNLAGLLASNRILKEFQPDVSFFTGGYLAAPMAIVAALRRIPSLLFVPDIEPGKSLKFLARFANLITVTTQESSTYFPAGKKLVETGYPTRRELGKWNKSTARTHFGLADERPTLLIFGGSKGARSINLALIKILPQLLSRAQVIHISGNLDWDKVEEAKNKLPEEDACHYHIFPFLHQDMGAALAAADLVVSRAGASILGEYPYFGIPAILVPYPHAWRYQKVNAEFLASRNAAQVLPDNQMNDQLLPMILNLLDHPHQMQTMQQAMQSLYSGENAANRIAELIWKTANHPNPASTGPAASKLSGTEERKETI